MAHQPDPFTANIMSTWLETHLPVSWTRSTIIIVLAFKCLITHRDPHIWWFHNHWLQNWFIPFLIRIVKKEKDKKRNKKVLLTNDKLTEYTISNNEVLGKFALFVLKNKSDKIFTNVWDLRSTCIIMQSVNIWMHTLYRTCPRFESKWSKFA